MKHTQKMEPTEFLIKKILADAENFGVDVDATNRLMNLATEAAKSGDIKQLNAVVENLSSRNRAIYEKHRAQSAKVADSADAQTRYNSEFEATFSALGDTISELADQQLADGARELEALNLGGLN